MLDARREEQFISPEETRRRGKCVRIRRAIAGEAAQTGGAGERPCLAGRRESPGSDRVSEKKHPPCVGESMAFIRARLPWSSELEREQVGTGVTVLSEHWLSLM